MHKLFEMINQEFKAQRKKILIKYCFGICCRELGGSMLGVFAQAYAVSNLLNLS